MESQGGEHNFRCPCFEDHAKYQKIVDLKDAGLIIYRQSTSNGNGNDKANIVRSTASTSKDIFILHNTKDSEILSADIMPAFEKNQISCPRCRHIIENAQKLLKSIPKINRNDVLGICDHCRRKLSRSPCEECEEVTRKFVMGIDETKVAKQHVKMWLSKIHRLLKDVVIGEKNSLKQKSRILSDTNFENLHLNSPVSLREPEVGDLFHLETLKTDSTKTLHMSNRSCYSQPGFHKIEKRTTFMDFSGQEIKITMPNMGKQFISRSYQGISHEDAYSSGSVLEFAHNSFKERKSVTDLTLKKKARPPAHSLPGKHYAEESAVTLRRHHSAELVIPHAKYQPEDIIDSSRKYNSEEALLTSISGIIEDQFHKDFGYFFPQELAYAKKIVKKRISSSELIKDTQDKLEAHAKEERLRLEELEKKKREEQENKRLAREEKKKEAERERLAIEEANRSAEEAKRLAEEAKRLAEEAKRLAEDESKRLAEEERRLLAEQEKQRLREEKKKQLDNLKQIKLAEKENKVVKKVENPDSLPKSKESSSGKNKTPIEKTKIKDPATEKTKIKDPATEKQENKEPAIAKPQIKDTIPEKPKIKESPPEKPAPEKTEVKKPSPEPSKLKEPPKIKEPPSEKPKAKDPLPEPKELPVKVKASDKPKKENPEPPEDEEPKKAKDVVKTEDKQEVKESLNPKAEDDFKKLLAEQAKQKEAQRKLKKQQEEEERKAKEAAEKKAREMDQVKSSDIKPTKKPALENPDNLKPDKKQEQPTTKELNIKQIKLRKPSGDDLILRLVQLRKATESDRIKAAKDLKAPQLLLEHKGHTNDKDANCVVCTDSDIELELESIVNQRDDGDKMADIIIGPKIFKYKPPIPLVSEIHEEKQMLPMVFKSCFKEDNENAVEKKVEVLIAPPEEMGRKPPPILIPTKGKQVVEQEVPKGVVRYALSDRSFIDKGWTMLPTEKVVRKMNVYRMRPAHPEFDWFEHNKNKRLMTYDTGEKLAEFDDNGRGRWFYKNGRLALDYYDAEETNAQQRFVVFSSGEPDERGRSRPITILATFDYLGNGIVFDHSGKIRLKYNQTEGVVLDRAIGPVSHWKWHTLNDPPVLQQVMIDTQMPHKDPDIVKLGGAGDNKARPDNEEMLAIEFDNFIKEKSKKLTQKFKPFQIKMKALKINECFSLRVLDQATVYLIFRDGSANFKMNIGMILDHKEIVDTDTAEVGEVSNSLERLPARTDSLAGLQRSVAHAQRVERARVERERRLRPAEPCASADRLGAAAARPLRPPFRTLPSATSAATTTTGYPCKCMKPSSSNVYYDTRLI